MSTHDITWHHRKMSPEPLLSRLPRWRTRSFRPCFDHDMWFAVWTFQMKMQKVFVLILGYHIIWRWTRETRHAQEWMLCNQFWVTGKSLVMDWHMQIQTFRLNSWNVTLLHTFLQKIVNTGSMNLNWWGLRTRPLNWYASNYPNKKCFLETGAEFAKERKPRYGEAPGYEKA